MRNLPREVVAAIETAVDCNDGVLESAFIHSLAKIYKTSPQAVVWNMKRHNKVKAGCDDRKVGGRPAVMDKDKAADYLRILMTEAHCAGERISLEKVAEIVSEHFGITVSTTWISRIMKKHSINHKAPREFKSVRVAKPKPQAPNAPVSEAQSSPTEQLPLPTPRPYPSFRDDLAQSTSGPQMPLLAPTPHLSGRDDSRQVKLPAKPLLQFGPIYTTYAPPPGFNMPPVASRSGS
ncbi:hypothetical protein VTL71DRAFT_7655 [Oculimacula yallundae]|uniref:HTH CENPB-type domain-containing protein n=1 Tax=Oculimacula yallundae TaxID=86028 RepID=A0ABR4BVJ6_9HELO